MSRRRLIFWSFTHGRALRLDQASTPIQFPGERNRLRYLPLGVGAVIAPWNFPLAILAGMTMAAVVTGNTVVVKPSVDAPTVAARFVMLLEEAGLPPGVVNLLQGSGELAGRTLVEHTQVRFISFTGSKRVGLDVHERAAKARPGQHFLKRTVLELGGKDAIIVDADCDIDAAVEGVAASAFGFSGQKCSACSRVIVDTRLYDIFLDKLVERVQEIRVGEPADNFAMGPVISEVAYRRVLDYIALGKSGRPHCDWRGQRWKARRAAGTFSRRSSPMSHRRRGWRRRKFSDPCWRSSGRKTFRRRYKLPTRQSMA